MKLVGSIVNERMALVGFMAEANEGVLAVSGQTGQ